MYRRRCWIFLFISFPYSGIDYHQSLAGRRIGEDHHGTAKTKKEVVRQGKDFDPWHSNNQAPQEAVGEDGLLDSDGNHF